MALIPEKVTCLSRLSRLDTHVYYIHVCMHAHTQSSARTIKQIIANVIMPADLSLAGVGWE